MREIDANTILIGTNAGRMLRMSWTGSTWTKTILASPAARYISCIAVDPSNPQRIWVTFSQIGGATVFRSNNGGTSWTNCTATLPAIPMNSNQPVTVAIVGTKTAPDAPPTMIP